MSACSLKRPIKSPNLFDWRPAKDAPASDRAENASICRCVLDMFSYGSFGTAGGACAARSCWISALLFCDGAEATGAGAATAEAGRSGMSGPTSAGKTSGSAIGAVEGPFKNSISLSVAGSPTLASNALLMFAAVSLSMSACVKINCSMITSPMPLCQSPLARRQILSYRPP